MVFGLLILVWLVLVLVARVIVCGALSCCGAMLLLGRYYMCRDMAVVLGCHSLLFTPTVG